MYIAYAWQEVYLALAIRLKFNYNMKIWTSLEHLKICLIIFYLLVQNNVYFNIIAISPLKSEIMKMGRGRKELGWFLESIQINESEVSSVNSKLKPIFKWGMIVAVF